MKNGLDPSLPHMGALMTRPGGAYPRRPLPEGFARDNAAAWALIDGRIAAWEGQKRD